MEPRHQKNRYRGFNVHKTEREKGSVMRKLFIFIVVMACTASLAFAANFYPHLIENFRAQHRVIQF